MVMPHAVLTCSMTSGLSGSPAPISSRIGTSPSDQFSWISMRHTVGGAQNVVTPQRVTVSSRPLALNRFWLATKMHARPFHGAKKQLQACLAQPGDEIFMWTSPGLIPIQYIVERCPTG